MNYLGVDPSTKTGLVMIHESGSLVFHTEYEPATDKEPERFVDITEEVVSHIQEDTKILIEGFSYGSKGQGVSTQYGIGWAIRIELFKRGIEYTEVTPAALKKFATGKGNTKKENMILPIYKKWEYEHDSDNVRDAYVLAQIGRYMDGHEQPAGYQKDVIKKIKGA